MPIEEPVAHFEEAVQKLKQCPQAELLRARRHHRRALEALHNGGYKALSDTTRKQLLDRLKTDLEALNHALHEMEETVDRTNREVRSQNDSRPVTHDLSTFLLQDVLPWNW